MSWVGKNLDKSWRVIWKARPYILAALAIEIVFGIVGFYFPGFLAEQQQKLISDIMQLTAGKGFIELALVIILNNLRASMIGLVLGIGFGVIPVLVAAMNGYFLGSVMGSVWKSIGSKAFLFIIPHGIFEIPAFTVAFGLGLKFGFWFKEKRKWAFIRRSFTDSVRAYFFIVVPLLVAAGLIESALIVAL
ncbi:stage II sporulation protein M [Candidatus Woesearchaeota archaeon]|nr:stage II sporulation protein M [Candidatus Woesearchaeota archaeon]